MTKITWANGRMAVKSADKMTLKFSSWLKTLNGLKTLNNLKILKKIITIYIKRKIKKNLEKRIVRIRKTPINNRDDHNEQIQNVPSFSHIRAITQNESISDNFEYCFCYEILWIASILTVIARAIPNIDKRMHTVAY